MASLRTPSTEALAPIGSRDGERDWQTDGADRYPRRARPLATWACTALLVALSGCGAGDGDVPQQVAVSCGHVSDCPAGQTCGPNGYCISGSGGGLPDGGGVSDGGFSFGDAGGDTGAGRGGDAGTRGGSDTGAQRGGDTGAGRGLDAGAATSCVDRCGLLTGGCACNGGCAAAGNCCDDYEAVCGGGGTRGSCTSDAQCDDGLPCTLDTCSAGKCAHTPGANQCLIDGKCVAAGTAGPGMCLVCAPLAKATGWSMDVGGSCDDGKACTSNDACTAQGSCAGTPTPGCCVSDAECASTLPCSVGTCDAGTNTCTYTAKPGCCSKDSDCTGNAQPCQVLYCNAALGACDVKTATDGAACTDGDGCTVGDACTAGFCVGKANSCDDNNPCTADSCQGGKCVNAVQGSCCQSGACCDIPLGKVKAKGTACGGQTGTQKRCMGSSIESRDATGGCNGSATTCSTQAGDQVWSTWKVIQTCAANQKCVETVPGQPTCQTVTVGKADLVPLGFKATTSAIAAGATVVVTGSVKNQGQTNAGLFSLEWRLSTDSSITATDTLLKTLTKGSLAAGSTTSASTSFTLPATTQPGTYYLGLWVDRSNKVAETSTSNNIATYKVVVTSSSKADLLPQSFSTKTTAAPGQTLTTYGSVKNQGGGAAGAFAIEWRLSTNSAITSGDTLLKVVKKTGLAKGAVTSALTSVTLPKTLAPGTYYLAIWVDRTNQVSETTTSNNIATWKLTVSNAAKPDLVPQSFKSAKATVAPGEAVTVYGSVKNPGSSAAGAFKIEWRLSTNTTLTTTDTLLKTLSKTGVSAGGLTSALTSVTVPATTKPGTYYLGIWVDRANQVAETNESNNKLVYKITVSTAKKADLTPVSFKSNTTSYAAGSPVTVYGSVKNQGLGPAGAFALEWRLSTNTVLSTTDLLLKTVSKTALAAGSSTSAVTSFTLPANTAPGTYYLGVWVDRANAVAETSETNNRAVYKITVTKPLPKPDLVPLSFKSSKTSYTAGSTVTVYGSVKNQGTAKSGAFSVEWRLSTNTTISTADTLLKTLGKPGVSAGSSTSALTSFTLPASTKPGTYYLGLWVDRNNQVAELNEANNRATYKITVTAPANKPDLVPLSFKSSKTAYAPGDVVSVSGTVKNQGTASAGKFTLEWRLSTNTAITTADPLLKSLTRTGLSAGGSTLAYTSFTLPASTQPGTYYLGLAVDRTNLVSESVETNNTAVYKITVAAPTLKPDLVPVSFKPSKTTYTAGQTMVVYGSVKNQGKATAAASNIEWRLSSNTTLSSGDKLLKTLAKGSLAAGTSSSALTSFTLPASTPAGTWYVFVKVDAGNTVAEASESNNTAYAKITVSASTAKPDLQVSSFKINSTSTGPGKVLSVTAAVKNAGQGPAGAFNVTYRLSTNTTISASDTLVRTYQRTSLTAGSTTSVSTSFVVPSHLAAGTYYVGVTVDEANQVSEVSESNNIASAKVSLVGASTAKADLAPYKFKATSATASAGGLLGVSGYVKNQGTLTAPSYKIEFRLSTNTAISTSDTLLKTVLKGSLSKGGLSSLSTSVKLPSGLKPGTYYLGLRIDTGYAVSESNEANNIGVYAVTVN